MKLVTAAQMRAFESYAIEQCQIPALLLMENAAIQLHERLMALTHSLADLHVCCMVNRGNNGGDALALARHLYLAHKTVTILLFDTCNEMVGDAKLQRDICIQLGIPTVIITPDNLYTEVRTLLQQSDWIVDGIFGTGLTREVTGIYKDVIQLVNALSKPVISVDIPSGLHADTGKEMGCCIQATENDHLWFCKIGLVVGTRLFLRRTLDGCAYFIAYPTH